MNGWIPTRLVPVLARQCDRHHESRDDHHYLFLALLLLGTIAAGGLAYPSLARMLEAKTNAEIASGMRIQDLSLAHNQVFAAKLLDRWQNNPAVAKLGVAFGKANDAFIPYYVVFLWFLVSWAWSFAYSWIPKKPAHQRARSELVAQSPMVHWGTLFFAIVFLAIVDASENYFLEKSLIEQRAEELIGLRTFAQTKLFLIALIALGTIVAVGVGLRREIRFWTAPDVTLNSNVQGSSGSFQELIIRERAGILQARHDPLATVEPQITSEAAEEPRLAQSNFDFVGLALSGGGIRSATFNLGVLQGLHRFDLLHHIDYLATVSGGGYIGSFWSRWLKETAQERSQKGEFPDEYKESKVNFSGDSRVFEAQEIRHIREFSNFLIPRIGIFDTETWGGAVALIASILSAIVTGLCVLGLSLILWLALTFYLAWPDFAGPLTGLFRAGFLGAITALLLWRMERWWRLSPTGDRSENKDRSIVVGSILAIILAACFAWVQQDDWLDWLGWEPRRVWMYLPSLGVWFWFDAKASYENWWFLLGIIDASPVAKDGWIWIPALYEPTIIWLLICALFLLFRFKGVFTAPSMLRRVMLPNDDRVAMRLLGAACLWALLATFWHIGINLRSLKSIYVTISGAAGSAALFALLRNWIGERLTRPHKTGLRERLKPYVPQVLAYLAIGLAWAALAANLININEANWLAWYLSAQVMMIPVLLVLLVDPHEFGLHAVYRDRICRTFLGAALPNVQAPNQNRQTDFRDGDDICLASLLARPLHLVCCAANNIGGDHLSTLSRGARSAVLSRNGIAMGDDWLTQPGLMFGSAVTASAAAANSNMGSVSMRVGPAVSFLMSALNLRLGLWVDNPRFRNRPRSEKVLPGWRYYKEMIAWTDISAPDIHLSDGGHFDNFGLYELVRRHCRYIIVSDATADPDVAFDDFGNTARRIREDFGIEIEIDLEPLKAGTAGRSRQHAVVGMIDYGWFDKGILIYIKPLLTGDEPVDIAQYRTRNPYFPHEGTGDQFYDEAQWESYRRLGVHAINKVFDFVEHIPSNEQRRVQKVFNEARLTWYPTPSGLAERSSQMTERYSVLERDLKTAAAVPMLREVFPEIDYTSQTSASTALSSEQELANIGCLLSIMTLMEDTITACDLQTHWRHPINLGWVNLFARWATTPTFQKWWPILKPLYGPGLREFLEDRFEVLRETTIMASGGITIFAPGTSSRQGFAFEWWQTRHQETNLANRTLYQYTAEISDGRSTQAVQLQLALVAIEFSGTTASWTSDHLFVPLSLWGSKLASHFLALVVDRLKSNGWQKCIVKVKGPSDLDNSQAKWEERQSFVDFYRQAGFQLERSEEYIDPPTPTGGSRKGRSAVLMLNLV